MRCCRVRRPDRAELSIHFCAIGIGWIYYHDWRVSLLFCLLLLPFQPVFDKQRAVARQKRLSAQFRDLLGFLSGSFSTSREIFEAFEDAIKPLQLIHGTQSLLAKELTTMIQRRKETRDSEESILMEFASRTKDSDVQSFVDVYLICRRAGGNLVQVIATCSSVLLDKLELEQEIQKLTAQKRYESSIILAIPVLMLLLLQTTSPDYVKVLYETAMGRLLMSISLFASIGSYVWSRQLTKVEL